MSTSSDGARTRLIKTRRGPWIDEGLLPAARQECLETIQAAAADMKARGEDPTYGDFAGYGLNTLRREVLKYEVPEVVEARNRAYEASEAGGMCGCCGRKLAGREPAYFGAEVYVGMWPLRWDGVNKPQVCQSRYMRTVLCGSCAPGWLSPERDDVVTQLCVHCERPMISRLQLSELRNTFCSARCERAYRRQLREGRPKERSEVCAVCGEEFNSTREAKTCSPKCRQKAYRKRIKESSEKQ